MHSISLRKNIIVSYISQAYVVLVGILVLPLYINWLGAEAYGLIGFFAMLQAMFGVLDLGLTPTISRETARYHAGKLTASTFHQLYRTMNLIFMFIAAVGGGAIFFSSSAIADNWLNVESLNMAEVEFAIEIMAICIALRWMTGLYRGVVLGSELLVWISGYNIIIATLRFVMVFPVMFFLGADIVVFFAYQLLVAILELIGLLFKSNLQVPASGSKLSWSLEPILPYLKFAVSIAFTSALWVVVTQTDKLIMSNILSLEDYGFFTLAVLVANGIMMVAGPISGAIMPRMARLEAEGKKDELIKIYRNSTQLITILAGCVGIIFVVFSEHILFVWTGDVAIVNATSMTLKFYAAGYAILAIGAFPYYLQYAIGNLKLHVIGSFLFVSILLPLLFCSATLYGMLGAGYAWLITNLLYLVFWTAIVHRRYLPGLHVSWLVNDVLKMLFLPFIFALVLSYIFIESSRSFMFIELVIVSVVVLAISAFSSYDLRQKMVSKFEDINE